MEQLVVEIKVFKLT
uniref:Uncharacterized protein n=1 Tax=Lutzomyia longipalpis TaxID=7200 RepID=A0A1B0GIZ0_LUTLO